MSRVTLMGIVVVMIAAAGFAQDTSSPKSTAPEKPVDQQLFDDLPPSKGNPPADKMRPRPPAGEDIGKPSAEQAPLREIGRRMRRIEQLLGQRDASAGTRELQTQVADDLARLIEELERQSNSSPQQKASASSQASAQQPQEKPGREGDDGSGVRPGASSGETADDVERWAEGMWGRLPDRVRQQIQNLGQEQFLPEYSELIRQYYKKLAERGNQRP